MDRDSNKDEIRLSEVLDRVLDKGIVISGDITLSVANIDLVYLGVRVLATSIENMERLSAEGDGFTLPSRD